MEPVAKYLSADERRQLTVEAVIGLAAEQNPSEITTAAIAQRMGVTQGALFRHFPSKDAIWESVMSWVADQLLAALDTAAQGADPLGGLRAMFAAHVDFAMRHPGVPRMMFGELQHARATPAKRVALALMQRYAARLQVCIEQGQASGEIAPYIAPQAAATLFIGTVQGLVMQSLLYADLARMRAQAPEVYALFERSLRSVA